MPPTMKEAGGTLYNPFWLFSKSDLVQPGNVLDVSHPVMYKFKFKIMILGSSAVGKTTLINSLHTGNFVKIYNGTMGVEVTPLTFKTSRGLITFNCWDVAGQERYNNFRDGYFGGAVGAIIMYDATSRLSYKALSSYNNILDQLCPQNIPRVTCSNKIDCPDRKIAHQVGHIDMSVKTQTNTKEPFIALARSLLDDPTLTFDME